MPNPGKEGQHGTLQVLSLRRKRLEEEFRQANLIQLCR